MQHAGLLYPVAAMVLLTFVIALRMLQLRIRAVRRDGLDARYFLLNRGGKLPATLVQVTQHYDNLFEMPVLFYAGVLAVIALGLADTVYLVLAWLYVLLRIAHALVHTTYNGLLHRLGVFLTSNLVLLVLWGRLLAQLGPWSPAPMAA